MELILYDNQIEVIETETFSGLHSIIALVLEYNKISKIEYNSFGGFKKWTKLWLNNNLIKNLKSKHSWECIVLRNYC